MAESDVIRVGIDSSGRPLLMTVYMWAWWQGVLRRLDFEPTIVQGAWMSRAGGGASDSGVFHNWGGCLDLRTWDLSTTQEQELNRVIRLGGAAGWMRYPSQGFDEHYHLVLGTDPGIGSDAALQWRNYLAGDAGLAGSQRDYMWRPDPIVTVPPTDYMTQRDGFDMADLADLRAIVREEIRNADFIAKIGDEVWRREFNATNANKVAVKKPAREFLTATWEAVKRHP